MEAILTVNTDNLKKNDVVNIVDLVVEIERLNFRESNGLVNLSFENKAILKNTDILICAMLRLISDNLNNYEVEEFEEL